MARNLSNPMESFTGSSSNEPQDVENAGQDVEDDEGRTWSWDIGDRAFERAIANVTGQDQHGVNDRSFESETNSAALSEFRNTSHDDRPLAANDGAFAPSTLRDRMSPDMGRISGTRLRVVNTNVADSPPSSGSSLSECWPCGGHHDPDKPCPNIQAAGPSELSDSFPMRQDRRSAADRLIERYGAHFVPHNPFANVEPPQVPLPHADRVIELASQDLSEQIRGMAPPVEVDTTWVGEEGPVKREDFKNWEARQEAESSTLRQLIVKAAQNAIITISGRMP